MEHRTRLREVGLAVGRFDPGPLNALVDVAGVAVGHVTPECTGVTAVLPHPGIPFDEKVLAGAHVVNGYGKATGLSQIEEMGTLESPILIVNTFSVGAAWHRIAHRSDEPVHAFSFLRDDSRPLRELLEMAGEVVQEAILNALCAAAPVPGRDALAYDRLIGLRPTTRD